VNSKKFLPINKNPLPPFSPLGKRELYFPSAENLFTSTKVLYKDSLLWYNLTSNGASAPKSFTELEGENMKKRIFAIVMAVIMIATLVAGAIPALAANDLITVRLHYHREDGQYTNENGPWEMWFWDPDAISDMNPPYQFVEENGEMVATIKLKTGTTNVGFIVRNGDFVPFFCFVLH
jgi:hypothetical protein